MVGERLKSSGASLYPDFFSRGREGRGGRRGMNLRSFLMVSVCQGAGLLGDCEVEKPTASCLGW